MKNKLVKRIMICIVILIFSILLIFIYNSEWGQNQVQVFNIIEYKQEITEFSSEKIFGYTRKMGEITSSKMAKEYAEKIWTEVYGKGVKDNKPYKVYWDDEKNAWMVTGTLKKYSMGGVPYIIFSKDDGEIIAVWHTR